ncbi:MAG: CBS domain-containing protein [Myxococcota bacterium]
MRTVRDLMTEDVTTVRRHEGMDKVHDLMISLDVRHMPVVDDEDELVGIISDRDVIGLLGRLRREAFDEQADALAGTLAGDVMTASPTTIEPDAGIDTAAQLLRENKLGSLLVVEGRHLVGILTEADFVLHVAEGN